MLRSSDSNLRASGNPARLPAGSDMITVAPLWKMELRETSGISRKGMGWRRKLVAELSGAVDCLPMRCEEKRGI